MLSTLYMEKFKNERLIEELETKLAEQEEPNLYIVGELVFAIKGKQMLEKLIKRAESMKKKLEEEGK